MSRYEEYLFTQFQNLLRNAKTQPTVLGGRASPGGGTGGPPGGFVGYLPQTRVAYDVTESGSSLTVGSGTLLDNLNHIRYRLDVLEGDIVIASGITISHDDTVVADGVVNLNFEGDSIVDVTDDGSGKVTVSVVASGALPSGYYTSSELDLLLYAKSDVGHTHTEAEITDLDHDAVKIRGVPIASGTPSDGDVIVYDAITNTFGFEQSPRTIYQQYLFTIDADNLKAADVGTKPIRIYAHEIGGTTATIDEVFCSVATPPASGELQVDVLKNESSIFDPPCYVTIAAGDNTGVRNTDFLDNTFEKNDYFKIRLAQGDPVAEYLTVHIRFHWGV